MQRALDELVATFNPHERLPHDPLGIVHEVPAEDREIVAHLAASLAYGRVDLIRGALRRVLDALAPSPAMALRAWVPGAFVAHDPHFVYRMTRAEDIDGMLSALAALQTEFTSLEDAFLTGVVADEDDLAPAASRYVQLLRSRAPDPERRGLRYLLPDPATGSAAKRLFLLLRWLVRPEAPDLGLWSRVPPAKLLLPLDTHTSFWVQALGLSRRRTADLKMTQEATAILRRWRPTDPVAYDMALCHLGIAGDCQHRFHEPTCSRCPLLTHCRVAHEGGRKARRRGAG